MPTLHTINMPADITYRVQNHSNEYDANIRLTARIRLARVASKADQKGC
jgi:hypothetical protein